MSSIASRGAAVLLLGVFASATASDPVAHGPIDVPAVPGETIVLEWTGEALPGGSGLGGVGGIADPAAQVGCPPSGVDDSHAVTLAVPEGAYEDGMVTADFQIAWEAGEDLVAANSRDLALTVWLGTTQLGHSDGGNPAESVGLSNPAAGEYTVVVCPFTSVEPVPYTAKLTLTKLAPNACTTADSGVLPAPKPATGAFSTLRPDARGLPNFDLFNNETRDVVKAPATQLRGRLQASHYDPALGVPTFLWARTDAPVAAVGALAERELLVAHAREHLRNEAKVLGLDAALIDEAKVQFAGFNGNGPASVRFRQNVGGLEVMHRYLNVLLDRSYRPIAVSGYFATDFSRAAGRSFLRSPAQAIASAWSSLGGAPLLSGLTLQKAKGDWQLFNRPLLAGSHWFEREPRVKKVLYPRNGALEPAYYVELFAKAKANGNLSAFGLAVSAVDGRVLHRKDLKADAEFTYRVFADPATLQPFDSPLGNDDAPLPEGDRKGKRARTGVDAVLVTLQDAGTGDPWLPEGATQTTGNNVDACIDSIDQGVDTPAGGLAVPPPVNSCLEGVEPRAPTTSANTFDHAITADADPSTQAARDAAAVNLFYINNWLHDWWYVHGFDEASGNAQSSNYGRGGEEGDPILAQGQDASGRNNANMATPADGSSPVMQQYLFDGPLNGEVRQTAPVAGQPLVFTTIANAGDTDYDITGELALVNDGMGVSPTDGCGEEIPGAEVTGTLPVAPPQAPVAPPDPALRGKIALVDRGNCNTTFKVQYALASGAIGVIVVNNIDGDPPTNIGNLDVPLAPVPPTEQLYSQTPAVIIRKDAGQGLKDQLASGATVTMHMARTPSVDADGTLDNQIIAHEFFHYVHHRLTDSSSTQAGGMSEGWGDINGFMLTVRADDKLVPGNAAFAQPYALASYTADDFLKGIRRVPYSTSMVDNGYTFRHIAEGEPEPNGGNGAFNAEVHASGEIWANQMFECYVGILTNPHNTFEEAQSKMQDYVIGGLKMTPADATFTEARDAVLAVVLATDFGDYERCSKGFAKRGSGLNAVSPARSSADLVGVVEDFTEFVCAKSGGGGDGGGSGGGGGAGGVTPEAGGGALGLGLLAPLLGLAALRRRRRH